MNKASFENLFINLSNSWILSCSILTGGILTCSYLKAINYLSLFHMKQKYKLLDLGGEKEKIMKEEKLINQYEKTFYIIYITGISITCFSILLFKPIVIKK